MDSLEKAMKELEETYNEFLKTQEALKNPLPPELKKYFGKLGTWDDVQEKYEELCNSFSPAYLSGCEWYQLIGKDFKKGYYKLKLLEFHKKWKLDEILAFGFVSLLN